MERMSEHTGLVSSYQLLITAACTNTGGKMKGSHSRAADWCPFVLRHSLSQVSSFKAFGIVMKTTRFTHAMKCNVHIWQTCGKLQKHNIKNMLTTYANLLLYFLTTWNMLNASFAIWCGFVYSISQGICTRFCCALLCCGYAIVHNEFTWSIYPYSSGLPCWHWGNH